jgi:Cu(I)/Ag(I) efflux system membrane fusion protein
MKLPRINRIPQAAVVVAVMAALALAAVSCRKESDPATQAGPTDTNLPGSTPQANHQGTTEMDQSMPGMKMPSPATPNAPATGETNMGNMSMPGDEHLGPTASAHARVSGRSPVDLDLTQRQFINIRTQAVTKGRAVLTIRTVGIVTYDETRLFNVNARIMGWAQKLYVDKPGQFVKQGDPLMDIYSPELYSAQYEYLLAYQHCERLKHVPSKDAAQTDNVVWQESMTEAQTLAASARKRLQLWEISDDEIAALEKSGKPADTLQLRAPVTGYVIEKNIDPAQMVMVGKTLYRVADLSTVWINADIYEYELPYVKAGQQVQVTSLAYPGRVYHATVDVVYPYSENKTRTTTARLVLDNREGLFKPNDYVNAEIKVDQGQRLLLPQTAVYDTGVSQHVFVEVANGHFVPRRVELGPTVGEAVVVNQGLAEGERVVVDGNFLLDSESQLRSSATGGGHQH